jgi:SSS family solute:Na+ symporter
LTLSSMLTRDVLPPSIAERHPVRLARMFLIVLAGMTFFIVIRQPASIFTLASASFSGYVTVVPTLLLGLHWRRFTVWGATASLLLGNLVLLLGFAGVIPLLGLLPVAWGLGAAIIGAVAGSLASEPTAPDVLDRFYGTSTS